MDISNVWQAIATAAQDAAGTTGLTCYNHTPDSIVEPCLFPVEIDINYAAGTFGHGIEHADMVWRLLVGRSDDQSAQTLLNAFLSPGDNCVRDAIEADGTLGGVVYDVVLTRVQGHRLYVYGTTEYLGADLTMRVVVDGT